MPDKRTIEKARKDKREGKSPSTQAGEFVKQEIEEVRRGEHGARSTKQAIAIGLSEARRAGVDLPPPKKARSRRARARARNTPMRWARANARRSAAPRSRRRFPRCSSMSRRPRRPMRRSRARPSRRRPAAPPRSARPPRRRPPRPRAPPAGPPPHGRQRRPGRPGRESRRPDRIAWHNPTAPACTPRARCRGGRACRRRSCAGCRARPAWRARRHCALRASRGSGWPRWRRAAPAG